MLVSESRGAGLEKPKRKLKQQELVERAIERMDKKLNEDKVTGTMSDLIRLLQLQKEMGDDQPIQVTVRWVDKNVK